MKSNSSKEVLISVLTTVLLFIVSIESSNCPAGSSIDVCSSIGRSGRSVYLSGVKPLDDTSHCYCTARLFNLGTKAGALRITVNSTSSGSCNDYLIFTDTKLGTKTFSSCSNNVTEFNYYPKDDERIGIELVHQSPTPSFTFCLEIWAVETSHSVNLVCNGTQFSTSTSTTSTAVTPNGGGPQDSTSTNNGGGATSPNNGDGVTSDSSPGNNPGSATSSSNGGGSTDSNGGATSPNNGGGPTLPNNGGATSPNEGGGSTSSSPGGDNGDGSNPQNPPANPGETDIGSNPSTSSTDNPNLGIIIGVIVLIILIVIIIIIFICAKKKMKKKMKVDIVG